jgi:hypothetical protein
MRVCLLLAAMLIVGCSKSAIDSARVIDPPDANVAAIQNIGNVDRREPVYIPDRIADMLRIQSLIDDLPKLGDPQDHFVFVGNISDVRPREKGDVLVGQCDSDDCVVAVVDIVDTGVSGHQGVFAGARIAVPVGNSKTLWEHLKQTETEIVFEYTKWAKRELVWKYGC